MHLPIAVIVAASYIGMVVLVMAIIKTASVADKRSERLIDEMHGKEQS